MEKSHATEEWTNMLVFLSEVADFFILLKWDMSDSQRAISTAQIMEAGQGIVMRGSPEPS